VAIADVAKHHSAYWTGDVANTESCQGCDDRHRRIPSLEEKLGKTNDAAVA
jgi:hypothetical protein